MASGERGAFLRALAQAEPPEPFRYRSAELRTFCELSRVVEALCKVPFCSVFLSPVASVGR